MPPTNSSSGDAGSSSSTVGHASTGVAWQVDLAKLTSLVTRVGMEGLKKLQLSGIDIHTIGCILALGEATPACIEFRSLLQKSRREQRRESPTTSLNMAAVLILSSMNC